MLTDRRTAIYGLNVMRMGVADYILKSEYESEEIDIIIDLLMVTTRIVYACSPTESWDKEVIKFLFKNIVNMRPIEDAYQIKHICLMLKMFNPKLVAEIVLKRNELSEIISLLDHQ